MPGEKIGYQCVLARNTGSWASPTWNVMEKVTDVTMGGAPVKADLSSRANAFKAYLPGQFDLNIEASMIWNAADADCIAIRDAYRNKTTIDIWAVDDATATATAQGWRFEANVFDFTREEPMDEGVKITFSLAPSALSVNTPVYQIT